MSIVPQYQTTRKLVGYEFTAQAGNDSIMCKVSRLGSTLEVEVDISDGSDTMFLRKAEVEQLAKTLNELAGSMRDS